MGKKIKNEILWIAFQKYYNLNNENQYKQNTIKIRGMRKQKSCVENRFEKETWFF